MYRKTYFVTVGRGCRINSCICRLKVLKKQNIKLYICTSCTKCFWVSITAHKPCISNISQAHAYLLLLFLYLFYSMHAGSHCQSLTLKFHLFLQSGSTAVKHFCLPARHGGIYRNPKGKLERGVTYIAS